MYMWTWLQVLGIPRTGRVLWAGSIVNTYLFYAVLAGHTDRDSTSLANHDLFFLQKSLRHGRPRREYAIYLAGNKCMNEVAETVPVLLSALFRKM